MPSRDEGIAIGVKKLQEALQAADLKIVRTHRFTDRLAMYFEIGRGQNSVSLVLSDEFLSDYPNTREQQEAVQEYIDGMRKRLCNPSPLNFYCVSGVPVHIEIEWPVQWVPNRAASFVWIRIRDLKSDLVSACSAIMTHQLEIIDLDLKLNPFLREEVIIESVRGALDRDELLFYEEGQLPTELPSVRIQKTGRVVTSRDALRQFLLGKVYWLAFRQGDKGTKVWISDPWDAQYLGVDSKAMLQIGQTLEAAEYIVLDADGFANAGRMLLIESESFEQAKPPARKLGAIPE